MYNPEVECKALISRISELCKSKGYSYYAIAKKANISTSTMYSIMEGKTLPQLFTLFNICNVLEIPIANIFETVEEYEDNEYNNPEPPDVKYSNLSLEEKNMLQFYRKISSKKRELLHIYIDMLRQYRE